MNMKVAFGCAIAVAMAGMARADYFIRWRVADSTPLESPLLAKVAVDSGSGYNAWLLESDANVTLEAFVDESTSMSGVAQGRGLAPDDGVEDAYANYNFRVELYGDGDVLQAISESMSYADLKSALNCVTWRAGMDPAPGVWEVSGFTAVPEPTSGLLLLLGAMLLGLKRKMA